MKVWFERAIFFSWYCSRGDCTFCYMSTQKSKIKNPELARRSKASILAETIICKNLGWEIEFISGGYGCFEFDEILDLIKKIKKITGKKQWINIGAIKEDELGKLKPYIKGYCGAVECINKKIHDKVCPSKPLKEIETMYKLCDKHNLAKSMTLIIGLGETTKDIQNLKEFIKEHGIERITFYALNPQKGTLFKKSPELEYYASWIKETRNSFPKITIIAGAWIDKPKYFLSLVRNGANAITKIPAIKHFNSKNIQLIKKDLKDNKIQLEGSLTKLPKINWNKEIDKLNIEKELKEQVRKKLFKYIEVMRKSKS